MSKGKEKSIKTKDKELEEFKLRTGAWLRSYREKAGMSQEKLAQKVGISNHAISELENGKTETSFYKAAKYVKAVGGSLDEIIFEVSSERIVELRQLCYEIETELNGSQQEAVLLMLKAILEGVRISSMREGEE